MGRICAQSEWRSKFLLPNAKEVIEANLLLENESGEVAQSEAIVARWPRLFPFVRSAMVSDVEGGCRARWIFSNAKMLLYVGNEKEAVELLQKCIIDHKHCRSLERYVRFVIDKSPNEELESDLHRTMREGIEVLSEETSKDECQQC